MRGAAMTKEKARSPARQALADAIARHHEVETELAQKTAARARTAAQVSEAELKVQDRRRRLDIAREEHVDKMEAAHDAGHNVATAPALGVREARDALHQAEDDRDALRAILARMDARLAGPQAEPRELSPEEAEAATEYVATALGLQPRFDPNASRRPFWQPERTPEPFDWLAATQKQVVKAAEAVALEHCDATIPAAVERARKALAEAQAAGVVLAVLARRGLFAEHHATLLGNLPSDVMVPRVRAWRDTVGAFRFDAENVSVAVFATIGTRDAAWNDAMAALQHDADAELPA